MKKRSTKPLSGIIQHNHGYIKQLTDKVEHLQVLQRKLLEILPSQLAPHVLMANINRQTVICQADSAIWASQLRFHRATLLSSLSAVCGYPLTDCKIIVRPLPTDSQSVQKTKRQLSPASAKLISSTATILDDPLLKESLYRLSKNQKKN